LELPEAKIPHHSGGVQLIVHVGKIFQRKQLFRFDITIQVSRVNINSWLVSLAVYVKHSLSNRDIKPQLPGDDSITTTDLETAEVVKIDDDGSKQAYQTENAVAISDSVTVTVTLADGEERTVHPVDRTYEWTSLALADNTVLELAELLDNGDSWVNLYRIYEFIQANIQDDDNIVEQGWWSASEKDLFKHTANSRDALGTDARHAKDQIPAPETPMSHEEAKRLIETLVERWLQHRQ